MKTDYASNCIRNWTYVAEHPDDDFVIQKMAKESIPDMLYLIRPQYLQSILDFGCGIGRQFDYFKKVAEIVEGYDIPPMIARCKRMNKELLADKLYDNWEQVKADGRTYNLITAFYVLQFLDSIDDLNQYITDMANMSYYLYFIGSATMDDENHTDIISFICNHELWEVVYYSPEDKGHLGAVFKSRVNRTQRPMLEPSTQTNSYVTQWTEQYERSVVYPTKPNALITIATGGYDEILNMTEPGLKQYADYINADYIKITNTTQDWWGLEKFRLKDYTQYYDRILFMDSDIFIRDGAPNIFDIIPKDKFGIFQEKEDLEQILKDILSREYRAMCRVLDMEVYQRLFINTGVMVFNSQHNEIFTAPTKPFKCYHCAEQDIVENHLLRTQTPLYFLPFKFNCQIWSPRFKASERDAYFIHFSGINFKVRQKAYKRYITRELEI